MDLILPPEKKCCIRVSPECPTRTGGKLQQEAQDERTWLVDLEGERAGATVVLHEYSTKHSQPRGQVPRTLQCNYLQPPRT